MRALLCALLLGCSGVSPDGYGSLAGLVLEQCDFPGGEYRVQVDAEPLDDGCPPWPYQSHWGLTYPQTMNLCLEPYSVTAGGREVAGTIQYDEQTDTFEGVLVDGDCPYRVTIESKENKQ